MKETIHGRDHPDIVTPLINLAGNLHYQKKYHEAEEFYRRASEITEKQAARIIQTSPRR